MRSYTLTVDGRTFKIAVKQFTNAEATLEVDGKSYTVSIDSVESEGGPRPLRSIPRAAAPKAGPPASAAAPPKSAAGPAGTITAPIPGLVLAVLVKEGQQVSAGDPLVKMEAMKMETVVSATSDGTVESITVSAGDSVMQGQPLMTIG